MTATTPLRAVLPRRSRRRAPGWLAPLMVFSGACSATEDSRAAAAPTTTTVTSPTTTAVERPSDPIDELVTISAGRLHIRCTGTGDTTVLLIAGWGEGSEAWAVVEPTIAERAHVCTYDRFGTGTSDRPPTTQTFETQAADLHELLDEMGESGPFVVVGHSFGGAEAVTFASTHSDEVDGLMLVDASPTTWPDTVCSVPAFAGGCALMRDPTQDIERLDVFPAFEAVGTITSLGDLPMTVLTAAHRSGDGLTPDELTDSRRSGVMARSAGRNCRQRRTSSPWKTPATPSRSTSRRSSSASS